MASAGHALEGWEFAEGLVGFGDGAVGFGEGGEGFATGVLEVVKEDLGLSVSRAGRLVVIAGCGSKARRVLRGAAGWCQSRRRGKTGGLLE